MAGTDLSTALYAGGFLLLIGLSVWYRLRLQGEIARLPGGVRGQLGWDWSGEISSRRHRRRIARRLIVRGLPDWVPLSEEARRDLFWHRLFGAGAIAYLVVVPGAVWGAWVLLPMLGLPIAAILAVQSWWDGPWGTR